MKLELKHLAPYLPYGLKYFDKDTNELTVMRSISYEINLIDMGWGNAHCLDEFKPILRPLSDLNKKIQKAEFYMSFYDHLERINPSTYKTQNCALMLDGAIEMQYYNDYQFLFEHHFDVFGLIEKGLAININTIN